MLPQVRPLQQQEKANGSNECVEVVGIDTIKAPPQPHSGGASTTEAEKLSFGFDRAYRGPGVHRRLFQELAKPLLLQFLAGFNATACHPSSTHSAPFLLTAVH